MAQSDWFDVGEYIEVFPYSTKAEQLGYMAMFSPTHYPPEDAPTWNPDNPEGAGSLDPNEKTLQIWYLDDIDDSGGTSIINWYYPTTGEAVTYFDFWREWSSENSFQSSRYDVAHTFITFDLSGLPVREFDSAEFVADVGAAGVDENSYLVGHFVVQTPYQDDLFDWRRVYTSSPSSGLWTPASLANISSGVYQEAGRSVFPLRTVPRIGTKVHLRLSVTLLGETPENFNGITITPQYDDIDDFKAGSEEFASEIIAYRSSLPSLRLWKSGEIQVAPEFSFNMNLEIDATIRAEPLFHEAKQRRNYQR